MRASALILGIATLLIVGACNSTSPTTPAAELTVEPATAAVAAANSVQLTVTGPDGEAVGDVVSWSSDTPHVVSVSASGLATAMYGSGTVVIRASVGAASGSASVTALSACGAPVPLDGTPPAEPNLSAAFEVVFDPGVDAVKRTDELVAQMGFTVTEMTANGFIATLSVTHVATLRCVVDVESMIFV